MKHLTVRGIIYCLFTLVTLTILVLSLISIPEELQLDIDYLDKLEHLLAYFVLGGLAFLAFASLNRSKLMIMIMAALFCGIFGGLIEIIQSYTTRIPEVLDFIADFIGGSAGAFATFFFKPMHKFI